MEYFEVGTIAELTIPGSDETICYRVWFDFDYQHGRPEHICGAPENCYPAEPDSYDITKIQLEISDGIWCNLNREYFYILEEQLIEDAARFIGGDN